VYISVMGLMFSISQQCPKEPVNKNPVTTPWIHKIANYFHHRPKILQNENLTSPKVWLKLVL
jgi:hypothetical protein